MSKRRCELCSNPARMFCDSDQASLCWDCDEKVHAANFLVAKHSRTLLCHVCHSPTPWKAAGPKLGPIVSVCHACAHRGGANEYTHQSLSRESNSDGDDREYSTTESDDSSEEDEDEDEDEDVDENQVVPLSASASDSSPAASTSGEDEEETSSSKRARDDPFPSCEDEVGCCSSQNTEISYEESYKNHTSLSLGLLRPLKMRREGGGRALISSAEPSSGTAAIVEKLRRFEQENVREESVEEAAMVIGLCHLARD